MPVVINEMEVVPASTEARAEQNQMAATALSPGDVQRISAQVQAQNHARVQRLRAY
jgi:hypothetical protein